MSRSKFVEPPLEFGPVSFWFLCHHLDKEEMSRQIAEMRAKGLAGFFLHPRLGLQTPYGSAEWFEMIEHAIEEARRHGLKPWFYDEDPYPSGAAGGRVFWDHPDYKARMLTVHTAEAVGGVETKLLLPPGRPVAAVALRLEGKPLGPQTERVDLTDQFGTIRDRECSAYWPRSYYPTIKFHPHSRSEMSGPRFALHWTPPDGRWKVLAFIDEEYKDDGAFLTYVDLMRPESVERFIELTHERYAERFGDDFDHTIPGIFTDEPKAMGYYPWTGRFLEHFREMHGYDLRPHLPALCQEMGPMTAKLRCDYRRTVLRLLQQSFFEPIRRWCEEHRLRFTGHVSPEEDPLSQAFYLANLMPLLKSFHIPGTDLIVPRVGDRGNMALNLGPKLVSSVAHQTGRERVMCETFACSGWHLTLADLRWITDWLYVLGVNMMVPHGMFYSIDGIRKIDAAPSLFLHQPWWAHFKRYASYVGRLSYMLSGGRHVCDVAILYPIRTMWALLPSQDDEATAVRDLFIRLNRTLLELQRDFDDLDEEDLQAAKIEAGALAVGPERYRVLILPRCRAIHRRSIERIEQFVAAGGTVLAIDALPHLTAEGGDDPAWAARLKQLFSTAVPGRTVLLEEKKDFPVKLEQALDAAIPRDAEVRSTVKPDVFVLHRSRNGRELYFVANTSRRPAADLQMSCPISALPQRWDPATGEMHALPFQTVDGRTQFALPLAARSSAFVVFDPSTENGLKTMPSARLLKRQRIAGPWMLRREADNVLPLTDWEIQVPSQSKAWVRRELERAFKLIPYREPLLYLIFGPAPVADTMKPVVIRYRTRFNVKGKPRRLVLVGEQSTVRGKATVLVNGRRVKPFAPQRLYDPMNVATDIGRAVRPGLNTLQLELKVDDPQGGLLEPLRLFGEFDVLSFRSSVPQIAAAESSKEVKPGSWTEQGLPFYSGTCCYEKTVALKGWPADARVLLRLPKVGDLAEVTVNKHVAGAVTWEPYELDLTERLAPGQNTLAIRVSNTAANLLELDLKPSGLLSAPVLEIRKIEPGESRQ